MDSLKVALISRDEHEHDRLPLERFPRPEADYVCVQERVDDVGCVARSSQPSPFNMNA
jgi:hypothetical protein